MGSRQRINAATSELSRLLRPADYAQLQDLDISWLADADDRPVVQAIRDALPHLVP